MEIIWQKIWKLTFWKKIPLSLFVSHFEKKKEQQQNWWSGLVTQNQLLEPEIQVKSLLRAKTFFPQLVFYVRL